MAKNDKSIEQPVNKSDSISDGNVMAKNEFVLINSTGINQEIKVNGYVFYIVPGENTLPSWLKSNEQFMNEVNRKKYRVKD